MRPFRKHFTMLGGVLAPLVVALLCVAWLTALAARDKQAPPAESFEQCKRLGRGVNVMGWDPFWKDRDSAHIRGEHFSAIHQAGFNNVRVVLHPFRDTKISADGKIDDAWYQKVDWVVDQALANHLMAILDFHEYEVMSEDPQGNKDRFLSMWSQIAEHFKARPRELVFEILNEPHGKLTSEAWNQLLVDALAAVRKSNPDRTLIVGPADWNSPAELDKLQLPEDDQNLIVTVHYYSPMEFTHQGAAWAPYKDKVGVRWTGSAQERQHVAHDFDQIQAWAEHQHRPIFLGEFGAYDKADMDSRALYTSCVAREAEKRGWSWAYWQFDGNFLVYDVPGKRWIVPIRDALIPPKNS